MRVHFVLQPELDDAGNVTGVIELSLNDVNHALSADLHDDDLLGLYGDLDPYLFPGPGVVLHGRPDNAPVGLAVSMEHFPDIFELLHDNGLLLGAQNHIQSILAVVASVVRVPHGNYHVTQIKIYLHCDVLPVHPV